MLNHFLKIIILGAVGGLFFAWPIFSLARGLEDFPIMEMTETVDRELVRPAEFLNYTIHFQNTGHWTAFDVGLKVSLPQETSLESASFPMLRLSQREIEFALPDIVPGDGQTIFIKARVNDEIKDGTVLLSSAVLSFGDGKRNIDPMVYAAARSAVGMVKDVRFASAGQAKEITAEVGSRAFLVNALLAFLAAGAGAGLTIYFLRIKYKISN